MTAARTRIAREIMQTRVITVAEDDPVERVLQLMMRHDINRIPVVRDGVPGWHRGPTRSAALDAGRSEQIEDRLNVSDKPEKDVLPYLRFSGSIFEPDIHNE